MCQTWPWWIPQMGGWLQLAVVKYCMYWYSHVHVHNYTSLTLIYVPHKTASFIIVA